MSILNEHPLASLNPELQMALGVLVEACGCGPVSLPAWSKNLQAADTDTSQEQLRSLLPELIGEVNSIRQRNTISNWRWYGCALVTDVVE